MSTKETLFCPHLYGSVCHKCIVKRKQCENCGWVGYNYEVCHECGHKSTMDECRTWAKFLRSFNDIGEKGIIDISALNEYQRQKMEGLIANEPWCTFETIAVKTKCGVFAALCYKRKLAQNEPQPV